MPCAGQQAMEQDYRDDDVKGTGLEHFLVPWWAWRTTRWIGGILLVLALAGYWGARPLWRGFKRYRAETMVRQAGVLLGEGRILSAIDHASQALQLVPDQRDALNLLARGMARTSVPRGALPYWERAFQVGKPSTDDLLDYADVAVREGLPELAAPILQRLMAVPQPEPRVLRVAASHHAALQQSEESLRLVRRLIEVEPANVTNQIALVRLLASRADVSGREEARQILWRLVRGGATSRLEALEHLVLGPVSTRKDREEVVALLAGVANPSVDEVVLLTEARMQLDPSRTKPLAIEALSRWTNLPERELGIVVAWLQRHRLAEEILGWVTVNRAKASQSLAAARFDALVELGRFEGAYRELLEAQAGVDPLDLELWRYRAAHLLKDEVAAERHRQQFVRAAGSDPWRLRRIAEFSQSNQMPDLAVEAWKKLLNDRFEGGRALRALVVLADTQGDTWAARDYLRRILKREPENRGAALAALHCDLLLGEPPAPATKAAEAWIRDPELEWRARFVAALGTLRLGEPERARALVAPATVSTRLASLTHSHRAILAAVLGGAGDVAEARRISRSIVLSQLRPEERELIRAYLLPEEPR